MDLQGVGAVAAAAVTAVGIPAALLVGRWQMRAAMRAAEATAHAGIAQAEATYKAALDAVRAQSADGHAQWRRGLRRDAYSALLLAAHQVIEAAKRANREQVVEPVMEVTDPFRQYESTISDLRSAVIIVSLEGPDSMVSAAQHFAESIIELRKSITLRTMYTRARLYLERRANDQGDPDRDAVQRLMRSCEELGSLAQRLGVENASLTWQAAASAPQELREKIEDMVLSIGTWPVRLREAVFIYADEEFHPASHCLQEGRRAEEEYNRLRVEFAEVARAALAHSVNS